MFADESRIKFLTYAVFGSERNPYLASSKAAYRDMCRTLRFGKIGGEVFRKQTDAVLENEVKRMLVRVAINQSDYDEWHRDLCMKVIGFYQSQGIFFTVGHAQKWINMMMKYLYIRGDVETGHSFRYFHVPIDQLILVAVEREFSIPRPCDAWSKIGSYETYINYQRKIREKAEMIPLLWEIDAWIREASRQKNVAV